MVLGDKAGGRVRKFDREASPKNIKKDIWDEDMDPGYEMELDQVELRATEDPDDDFQAGLPAETEPERPTPELSAAPKRRAPANSTFGDDEELAAEPPPNWTLTKFQENAKALLIEYYVANALEDTVASIGDLLTECPCEADELGVLAMQSALDRGETAEAPAVALIKALHTAGLLESSALVRSFEKLFCTWQDRAIDVPRAPVAILSLLHKCQAVEVVETTLLTKIPENLLDAGLADLDQDFKDMVAKVASDMKVFKRQVSRSLEEYFSSSTANEVELFLRELKMNMFHHEFVKKAITLSYSQSPESVGREAVVALLAHLTATNVLSKDDLHWGVTRLLSQLDDLILDHPRVMELTTEVGVSLVAGELVSVPFLRRCRLLRIGGTGGLRLIDTIMRRTPEYSKKNLATAKFKSEIKNMILEYFNTGDETEFGRCVAELAPLNQEQSAELVRKVMTLAIERSGAECEAALKLLVWLTRHEEVDGSTIELGFDQLYSCMPDLLLDVPDAREMALSFIVEAKKAELLREEWNEPD